VTDFNLVFGGVCYIVLGMLSNPLLITIVLFIVAIVAEAFRPANSTAFAQICPPELRARGFALNRLAINLGVTIGPALGGILAMVNYTLIFWVDGLTCLIASIFLWVFFNKSQLMAKHKPQKPDLKVKSPWRDSLFLLILLLLLLMGIIFIQLFNTWPLYMRQHYGLAENRIGLLLAINALLIVLFELPLIHKMEGKNYLKVMAIGALFLAVGFGILPFGSSYYFVVVTVIIWTIGEMLVFPLMAGFIANRATDDNRGKYMGLFSLTFSLAFVLGPAIGGWIYDYYGSIQLWLAAGILGILITMGFLIISKYQKST